MRKSEIFKKLRSLISYPEQHFEDAFAYESDDVYKSKKWAINDPAVPVNQIKDELLKLNPDELSEEENRQRDLILKKWFDTAIAYSFYEDKNKEQTLSLINQAWEYKIKALGGWIWALKPLLEGNLEAAEKEIKRIPYAYPDRYSYFGIPDDDSEIKADVKKSQELLQMYKESKFPK